MAKQPWGIKLASLIIWIEAGLSLAVSLIAVLFGTTFLSTSMGDFAFGYLASGWYTVVIALLMIVLGYLVWKHYTVAWWIAMVLAVLGLLSSIIGLWAMSFLIIINLALAAVEVIALFDKEARKACKIKL